MGWTYDGGINAKRVGRWGRGGVWSMMEGVTVKRVGCGGGWGVSSLWRTAVRSWTRLDESDRDWDGVGGGGGGRRMGRG